MSIIIWIFLSHTEIISIAFEIKKKCIQRKLQRLNHKQVSLLHWIDQTTLKELSSDQLIKRCYFEGSQLLRWVSSKWSHQPQLCRVDKMHWFSTIYPHILCERNESRATHVAHHCSRISLSKCSKPVEHK